MVRRSLAMRNLLRARDGGRLIRRRRKHIQGRRVANLMPPKPRKPPSGFNLFVRDYFRTAMARNFHTAPAVMPYAGQIWRNNPVQRQRYEIQARPELARYRRAYNDYQAKRTLLKRPGNAFICFAKDLWHRQGEGRSISEMARLGSGMWRTMTPAQQEPYKIQARESKRVYDTMLEEINSGRARLEDYMVQRNRRPNPAPAAAAPGGGQVPVQGQAQPQGQAAPQAQVPVQGQAQPQGQAAPQAQVPLQGQAQAGPQAQVPAEGQA